MKGGLNLQKPSHILKVLKTCTIMKDLRKGCELHAYVREHGFLKKNAYIGTTLVNMYARCGELGKAQQVFQELPIRNEVTWSALIASYAQQGLGEEALKCFDDMLCEGHSPNAVTFLGVLKACGNIEAVAKGKEIHDRIVNLGMLEKEIVLGTTLVNMYGKCGALDKAKQVLKEFPVRNVTSWSALIAGYAQQGQGEEALTCFDDMIHDGQTPNAVTFASVLKACGSIRATCTGEEIHDKIANLNMLKNDVVLGNALVDMYVKCGALVKAQQVLEELPIRNVVSWSTLIAGYVEQEHGDEALKCFSHMLHDGYSPNAVTLVCALKASCSIGAVAKGREIHDRIVNLGMLLKDVVLGTTLVDMNGKCGALGMAKKVFEELPARNVFTWNALIAAYIQHRQGEEALKCFDDMLHEGHSANLVSFVCVLKACGSTGAASKGEKIHNEIVRLGMLKNNLILGTALLDMYVKCGELAKAQRVLEELPVLDVVTCSVLIAGCAQWGHHLGAISCFEWMQSNGVKPNLITLTSMLNASSHSGLLGQMETYLLGVSTECGIRPDLEHFCCIVDLLSRAGMFDQALSMIAKIPSDKCLPSWVTILGACRKWGEVKIGRLAFEHALQLDKSNVAVYILMAKIYTAAGMQEEANKIEVIRAANKVQKMPRCCATRKSAVLLI